MDGGEVGVSKRFRLGSWGLMHDELLSYYGARKSLDGYPNFVRPHPPSNPDGCSSGSTPDQLHSNKASKSADGRNEEDTLDQYSVTSSYCEARNSVDGTGSYGILPTPRPTPGGTPSRMLADSEAARKSAYSTLRWLGINGVHVTAEGLSDEDELKLGNQDHEEIISSRISTAAASPRGLSTSNNRVAAQVNPAEGELGYLALDVEGVRSYAAMALAREERQPDMSRVAGRTVRAHSSPLPISLKFVGVRYKVLIKQEASCRRQRATEKDILHGITGQVDPGEMLAMMGPSGSGKTTLLNALGGRIPQHTIISGTTTYNNLPFSKNLKRRMGFVTQDDVLYPHLTVRETLIYAALLRLPKSFTRLEKIARADEVVRQLGLEKCRDTIIGGMLLRGISGGERKRVSIGHEILIDPSLMFLDEPTSGLDSTTALRIIQLLQSIAKEGRTVVTTIHQPSSRLFYKFDKLILLSEGHSLYFGKAIDAMNYFESIGFSPLITMNPADFLLDLCSGNTNDVSVPKELERVAAEKEERQSAQKVMNGVQGTPTARDVREYLVECYEKQISLKGGALDVEACKLQEGGGVSEKREWNATWWQQFSVLLVRGLKERRHEYLSKLRIIQVVALAFLCGCLWWGSGSETPERLQDQTGLLFFVAMFWGYFPLFAAIFTFPLERTVLAKERASHMYQLSAYFLARTLGDLPLDLLLPSLFLLIVYFMARLRMSPLAFFLSLLVVLLAVITSQGVGLFIGAAMMDVKAATTFASIVILAFMLAGGFFVQHIPGFIHWLKYLSFQSYSYELLIKVQYHANNSYDCGSPNGCRSIASSPSLQGITLGGGGKQILALFLMIIAYRILAYMALARMKTS